MISWKQVGLVTLISVTFSPMTSRPTSSRPRAARMGPRCSAISRSPDNHVEQVQTQLAREPRPYPTMTIKHRPASIFDYEFEDFDLSGYDPHPAIKAPVAV